MERLLLVLVPLLALTAFVIVRKQYGQIVPAPPAAIEQEDSTPIAVAPTLSPQPTILEARAVDEGEQLPPGINPLPTLTPKAADANGSSSNPIILIPDPTSGSISPE